MINFSEDFIGKQNVGEKNVVTQKEEVSKKDAFKMKVDYLIDLIKNEKKVQSVLDIVNSHVFYELYPLLESVVREEAEEYSKKNKVEVTEDEKLMRVRVIVIEIIVRSGREDIIKNSIGYINRLPSDIASVGNASSWSLETADILKRAMGR